MTHWVSNKGKYGIGAQGQWEDAGATAINLGLLAGASTPAAIDTEAEIQDFNTVGDLLGATGVDEPVGGWYARQNLSRSAAVEDDTNNRVNMDTANVTFTAATAGETIYGGFIADKTVDTNDTTRLFWSLMLWTPVPLNGSDLTLTIVDLYRVV